MLPKILLVDDEKLARQRLRRFLEAAPFKGEILEARNGLEAIETIQSVKPQIVFLDVQMPGLNGFEVLQQLEGARPTVVFQTAYDEFAIRAFEENACDYLLKPFTLERFEKALARALQTGKSSQKLEGLEDKLLKSQKYLERLVIKASGKTRVIEVSTISHFVSQDHYTFIYTDGAEVICELSLNWLAERLNPRDFVRCHRNNIVSLKAVQSVGGTQNSEVTLKSGQVLPLSRSNRKELLACLT